MTCYEIATLTKNLIYDIPVSHKAPNTAWYLKPTHPGRSRIPTPDVHTLLEIVCAGTVHSDRAPGNAHSCVWRLADVWSHAESHYVSCV